MNRNLNRGIFMINGHEILDKAVNVFRNDYKTCCAVFGTCVA